MIPYKKIFKYLFISILVIGSNGVLAASGTIDATYHGALLCANASCSTYSKINFGKFLNTPNSNVTVSDTALSGFIWGENFGWVVLNCSDTASGCTSANGNFKVANDGKGHLSGYAWGENTGWINFGPFLNSDTNSISINSAGQFGGWAWSQNNGWIKFDCSVANACVVTDWRPDVAVPPTPPVDNRKHSSSGSIPINVTKITVPVTPIIPPVVVPVPPTIPSVSVVNPINMPTKNPTTLITSLGGGHGILPGVKIIFPTEPTIPPILPIVINKAQVAPINSTTSNEKNNNQQINDISCKTGNIFRGVICVTVSFVSKFTSFFGYLFK